MTPERPEGSRRGDRGLITTAETVAFMLLGGIVTGLGLGAGIDWLVDTFPLFSAVGVFVGFALALYAVYLETK